MARINLGRWRLPFLAGDPTSPNEGEIWYNQATDQVKYKAGGTYPVPMGIGTRFNDYALNRWYPVQVGASGTATATASRAFTNPFMIPKAATLGGVSIEVATAWTTTGSVRAGIYNDDGSKTPSALVADFGLFTATAGVKVWSPGTVLAPGVYWLVVVNQGGTGTTTGQYRSVAGIHDFIGDNAATPTFFNTSVNCYYTDTGFTGAFPSTFGAIAGIVAGPRFAIRFSS